MSDFAAIEQSDIAVKNKASIIRGKSRNPFGSYTVYTFVSSQTNARPFQIIVSIEKKERMSKFEKAVLGHYAGLIVLAVIFIDVVACFGEVMLTSVCRGP